MIEFKLRKFRVPIIGTGNLSKALVQALLRAGLKSDQMVIIARPSSNIDWFTGFDIPVSTSFSSISDIDATHMFIAVDSLGAGYALQGIKNAGLNKNGGYRIISLTPGLSQQHINDFLCDVAHFRPIIARFNVNIEYGKSETIHYTEWSDILEHLGYTEKKNHSIIEYSTLTLGLMNSLHCVANRSAASFSGKLLGNWLSTINELSSTQRMYKLPLSEKFYLIRRYLELMTNAVSKGLGYNPDHAKDLVLTTYVNNTRTVKKMLEMGIGLPDPTITLQRHSMKSGIDLGYMITENDLKSDEFVAEKIFDPFRKENLNQFGAVVDQSIKQMRHVKLAS